MSGALGDYEIRLSKGGFANIKQTSSGEVMHDVSHPMVEAELLYVKQSRLAERLGGSAGLEPSGVSFDSEVVIWDVGLGAAANAMAVVRCFEASPRCRRVHLVSFEPDLDSLKLALEHLNLFPYLDHEAPGVLLKSGSWVSEEGHFRWTLIQGEFLATYPAAPLPNLIFYDLFSSQSNQDHWSAECFQNLFAFLRGHSSELITYSASTAFRASLLNAGFYVARGIATGPKIETTVALTPLAAKGTFYPLLGEAWFQRWQRSTAPFPKELPDDDQGEFQARVLAHPQFSGLSTSAVSCKNPSRQWKKMTDGKCGAGSGDKILR